MTWSIILLVSLIVTIVIVGRKIPTENAIYKGKDKSLVLVTNIYKHVVTLQYVEVDKNTGRCTAITGPQNWDIWEFIKTFKLWRVM